MTSALAPVRDPHQALAGWVSLIQLAGDYGITIAYVRATDDTLGEWDSTTCTIYIRDDASLLQQLWLLRELWWYVVVGPEASPSAERLPLLQLVPPQRSAPEEQTA